MPLVYLTYPVLDLGYEVISIGLYVADHLCSGHWRPIIDWGLCAKRFLHTSKAFLDLGSLDIFEWTVVAVYCLWLILLRAVKLLDVYFFPSFLVFEKFCHRIWLKFGHVFRLNLWFLSFHAWFELHLESFDIASFGLLWTFGWTLGRRFDIKATWWLHNLFTFCHLLFLLK